MLTTNLAITFHGIGEPIVPLSEGEGRYFVPVETYRRTIACLDKLEQQSGCRVVVTFDDGNLSDYEAGVPALLDAGRSGEFFVLAGRIGQQGYLNGEQIREMVASGMKIGSHGWDHIDWTKLDEAGRQREFHDARRRIEDEAGVPVLTAAIPFGAFDPLVLSSLKAAGYSQVSTSTSGMGYRDAWFRPRWSVQQDFSPERDLPPRMSFKQILKGTAYAQLRRLRYRI
ncbi:polysaccharide deacetylase family protein [Roseibium litorale]|uniref:Chitooligosaccharide deacetylase n=1 Tax=Roseibium litorale TaxID=2803841 RepID=A0ABR9CNM7_9HYPH|nr:polysaccharide deacetylase family protein [Roseibium litorale]MBD8892427.1 polysaccharide deacetylase family protein [Roseibium litorale]